MAILNREGKGCKMNDGRSKEKSDERFVIIFMAIVVCYEAFMVACCNGFWIRPSHSDESSSYSSSSSGSYSSGYSSDYDSSYTPKSSAGTWGDGYDHILNDSDPDPWDGYGYDSPSVSEDEAYIDKINGEWVFIH